jgi:hypothetical protein
MSTLMYAADAAAQAADVVYLANGTSAETLTDNLMDWIKPIGAVVMAAIAVSFLIKRQMSQFIQFLVIALVVGLLLFKGGDLLAWGSDVFGDLLGVKDSES